MVLNLLQASSNAVNVYFTPDKMRPAGVSNLPSAYLSNRNRSAGSRVCIVAAIVGALAGALAPVRAIPAQTDYYNTDAGRPLRIEDAYALERRGFELQVAPFRLERSAAGQYRWGIEPEIAYGIFPRTQLEVGFPIAWLDGTQALTSGLAGIDVSMLHNLNAETRIPALAVAVELLLPAGSLAPDRVFSSIKGIATKTFSFARFHFNGQYRFGDAPGVPATVSNNGAAPVGPQVTEVSRWMSGVAVDRTFPLHAVLISGEVYAQGALADRGETDWNTTIGTRYQLSPRWAMDAGIGRKLTGIDRAWSFTMGGAVAFGLPWKR
ncbi:MAG: hypothetical protein H7Z40_08915 [Phycisphaerae bacterium]|nr:hypothetical protein [Gemmatimonadaceae bacterium]